MTRIELAGLMLGLLVVSVAGGISWRLFRPHRGEHIRGLVSEPGPNFYPNYPPGMGSMILEEETRLRGDWQDAYVRELAPETLDEEAELDERSLVQDRAELDLRDSRAAPWRAGDLRRVDGQDAGAAELFDDRTGRGRAAEMADDDALLPVSDPDSGQLAGDLISMMSDEDFFHMARFEFRRLEWMASEPLTLPAWTGRAA